MEKFTKFFKEHYGVVIGIVIGVIAGAVIGIAVDRHNFGTSFNSAHDQDLFSLWFHSSDTLKYNKTIEDTIYKRHHITNDYANTIINNYTNYDKKIFNASLHTGQRDSNGNDHLKFFFIPKGLLDILFKINPKDIGIRLWVSKEGADNKRIFTFAIVGVKPPIMVDTKKGFKQLDAANDTSYFNYVDTCPNNCNIIMK